jgi:hypothetical protein
MIEEMFGQRLQPFVIHVLAKKYSYPQPIGKRTDWHCHMMLPSPMDQNAIHPAAFFQIRLSRGLAMYHRQIVAQSRYGPHWHAVRDEHSGHITLPRCGVERDAMGVAVTGHDCNTEARVFENLEIPRVETDEFKNAEHLEELMMPVQTTCDPETAAQLPCDRIHSGSCWLLVRMRLFTDVIA